MNVTKQNKENYLRPEEVSKLLKVTVRTLLNWDYKGELKSIRTKGGHRRYLESDVFTRLPAEDQLKKIKRNICYCRVSTPGQREDLERQAQFFSTQYPQHEIIKDIGSGINFKRKGFNSILDSAVQGDIGEVVVTHKDRLCRFGFELVLRIIKSTNGEIVVLDKQETSPEKELVNDIISIITVFSSRLYGLRSNSIKNEIRKASTSTCENIENTTISEHGRNEEV